MEAAPRQTAPRPNLGARFLALVRWAFLFAVAAAAIFVIGGTLALKQLDEEIRQHVEQKFQLHYAQQGLVVRIGSARRVEGKGIELRDIRLIHPDLPREDAELAYIGEGLVSCSTDLADILAGNLRVGHVAVRRLKVRATREADGGWNARRLFPLPQFSDCPPQGTIEQGVVEIVDRTADGESVLTLRDMQAQIVPEECAPCAEGESTAPRIPPIRVQGSFAGEHFERVRVNGRLDAAAGIWLAQGTAEGVQVSPALRDALPREAAAALAPLAALRGALRLEFSLSRLLDGSEPPRFVVSGELTEGQIEDPRLPYPLTEIRARVYCDNDRLTIDRMTAKSGVGVVQLTCRREGLAENSPLVLRAQARQIELDARLAKSLPSELRGEWEKLNPAGQVHLDLSLAFDGRRWQPSFQLECVDVSFAHHLFPYRLTGGVGTISLAQDVLTVRLKALAAGQVASIDGEFRNPGPDFTGSLVVAIDRPIPIDDALLSALDEKSRAVVRALRPRGEITCTARFDRLRRGRQIVPRLGVEIQLVDCAVRYEKFPYPIEQIRGQMLYTDDGWEFKNLSGHNGSAYVTCEGAWSSPERGGLLKLDFVATDVPLEDELRRALGPDTQRIWNDLRPRGVVDHLKVGMTYSSTTDEFGLSISAQKWKRQQNLEGRGISIEPSWFPYRLDYVTGQAHYRDGNVTFENMSAAHGSTRVRASGRVDFAPEGDWRLLFERFSADRVRFDQELLAALPAELRSSISRLNPTGPLNLLGGAEFKGNSRAGGPPAAAWDMRLDMEDGALDCGLRFEHVRGGARLVGNYDGRGLRTGGELTIDSLVWHDMQFTGITGPLAIDGTRVFLGGRIPTMGRSAPRQITGSVYGGALALDGQVSLGGNSEFDVSVTLTEANLAELSQELLRGKQPLVGKGSGNLHLTGNNRGTHTWRGEGSVRLREADIYEAPLMLAVLKLLSIKRPNKTAFNNADVDFHIQGDRLYFDRLDFKGDAITLKGSGEMDLDRRVNMQFYTLVGRDEIRVPIITPMLGLASQQLLLIEVAGTVEKPDLKKKAFPALNDTLRQLFPELQDGTKTAQGNTLVGPREALERSGLMRR